MNRKHLLTASILALGAATTAAGQGAIRLEGDPARRAKLAEIQGKPAPAIEAQRWLNGKPLKVSDLKGKVILLDFWGKW